MTAVLLAFLCGAVFGYFFLRASGWLVVILLCTITAQSAQQISVTIQGHNQTSSNMTCGFWGQGGTRYWSGNSLIAPGNTWSVTINEWDWATTNVICRWYSYGDWLGTVRYEQSWQGGINSFFHSDYYGPNGPPPTYYASGCLTNDGQWPARIFISYSDGTGNETSPLILPGQYWCPTSRTNSSPFSYRFSFVEEMGGTNLVATVSDWYPAWTNTVPSQGGTGSGAWSPTGVNNPMGSPAVGTGSTNGLTGGQFAAGMSNLVGSLFQMGQNLGRQIAWSGTNSGTTGPGITNDYTTALERIRTNTSGSFDTMREVTNLLRTLNGRSLSNANNLTEWYDTNGMAWASNLAYADGTALSNAILTAGTALTNAIWDGTNIVTANDESDSVWKLYCTNYLSGAKSTITLDLNPMHQPLFAAIAYWVRGSIRWFIMVWALWYVLAELRHEASIVVRIPGKAPQGAPGLVGWLASLGIGGMILASYPVLLIGVIQTYTDAHGGFGFTPFSSAAITAAGDAGKWVRAAINLADAILPLWTLMSTVAFLCVFDLVAFGRLLFVSRMQSAAT